MNIADRVTVTVEDAVAHVLLDRPDKLNALDAAMFEALREAGRRLFDMPEVRCVVLSGAGRGFCTGIDLGSLATEHWDLIERGYGNANWAQQVAMVWRKLPMPVIAAIHGVCMGGGLQVASGACIRICAPDARLAVMEMKWGLVPDMAGYALWRGNVRDDVLRELTYTHREFSGTEAVALGLATVADPQPLPRAMAMAREIAQKSPHAMRAAKSLSNRIADLTVAEILMAESQEQQRLLNSPNQREAVAAGLSRRPSQYVDPVPSGSPRAEASGA